MQLEFKFYIDGSEIDAPDNWESFKMILQRDPDLRGVLRSFSNAMTVTRTDFATLYAKIENHLFDTPLTFRVDYSTNNGSTYSEFMSAYIFIDDISFDLIRRTAEFTLTDISYSAKIQQNADYEFSTSSITSKNGTSITAARNTNDYFSYSDTAGESFYSYDELLRYILDYITDASVTVDDNWYSTLNSYATGNDEVLVFYGPGSFVLSNYAYNTMVGFKKVFVGIARLFNLWYSLVESGGTIYFTIDTESNHFSSTAGITLEDFTKFTVRFSSDYSYTSVKFGDKQQINKIQRGFNTPSYLKQNPINIFGEYVLFTDAESNIERSELDLTTEFAFSYATGLLDAHYTINDNQLYCAQAIDNGSALTAASAFSTPTYKHTAYGFGGSELDDYDYIYNDAMLNENVLARYNFLGNLVVRNKTSYSATLYKSSNQAITAGSTTDVSFNRTHVNSSDPQVCWVNAEDAYLFKGAADQGFTYRVQVSLDVTDTSGSANTIQLHSTIYEFEDEENITTAPSDAVDTVNVSANGSGTLTWDFVFNVDDPKNYIKIQVLSTAGNFRVDTGSTLTITQQDTPGRTIRSANSSAVKAYEIEMESFCTISEFLTIWQDPRKRIALNLYDENTKYAWVKDLEYTPATGQLEGTLMTDDTNLNT